MRSEYARIPRRPRVLIVADDLTGAMDSAGPFAQRGCETWVIPQVRDHLPEMAREAQVVSLNTESRHLPAAQAASRVAQCVSDYATQGFDILFKKIDSTLRGNVVAETHAAMQAAVRPIALVAPAFPAQGRTVREGRVYVNGVVLADTEFARDALSPPPTAALTEVFRSQVGVAARHWTPGTRLGAGLWIADADQNADLDVMIAATRDELSQVMLVGSAGLGQALAASIETHACASRAAAVDGCIVLVIGSRAAASRAQVASLLSESGTIIVKAVNGRVGEWPDLKNAPQIAVVVEPDPQHGEGDPAQVARDLAQAALTLVRRPATRALVATGGDTAMALLQASGCPAVQLLGELMPGIPCAQVFIEGRPIRWVSKAGGFGGADALRDVVRVLRSGTWAQAPLPVSEGRI
ncbi:MAG: four-carbon acid sugar kinase family protein [Burkholderiales bacterium]